MGSAPYTNEEIAALGEHAFPQRGTFCPRCRNFIPSFAALPPEDETRLRTSGGASSISELQRQTGCNAIFAKLWWIHPQGPHAARLTPPCPYCGAPLFTEKSKQCLTCGWDWHDEAKPVRHPVKKPACSLPRRAEL